MLFAYALDGSRLRRQSPDDDLTRALWVDLYRPAPEEASTVAKLGIEVPTLADMEEIEISNRLYRESDTDYMTTVVTGWTPSKEPVSGPVTFIVAPGRLITVRHHAPRPFETFPDHADRSTTGCSSPGRIFLGLIEEIVARQADLLEALGRVLDDIAKVSFGGGATQNPDLLEKALERIGREGEQLSRIRLALLTVDRALGFYGQTPQSKSEGAHLQKTTKALKRDIQSLEVHADFLASRVGLISDATMGLINLAQNVTVRIISVVAALFLPPTLIASIYGMNFDIMPELHLAWGYPAALVGMVAAAVATYLYFRWKGWL